MSLTVEPGKSRFQLSITNGGCVERRIKTGVLLKFACGLSVRMIPLSTEFCVLRKPVKT